MDCINKKRTDGFDENEFNRLKKAFYGSYLRGFNDVETTGNMITRFILSGINIFNFNKIYETIDLAYCTTVFNEIFTEENMAMSVVWPVEK